jgi:hypothetical protein
MGARTSFDTHLEYYHFLIKITLLSRLQAHTGRPMLAAETRFDGGGSEGGGAQLPIPYPTSPGSDLKTSSMMRQASVQVSKQMNPRVTSFSKFATQYVVQPHLCRFVLCRFVLCRDRPLLPWPCSSEPPMGSFLAAQLAACRTARHRATHRSPPHHPPRIRCVHEFRGPHSVSRLSACLTQRCTGLRNTFSVVVIEPSVSPTHHFARPSAHARLPTLVSGTRRASALRLSCPRGRSEP